MQTVGVIYGSTSGNTQRVAKMIGKRLDATVMNVSNISVADFDKFEVLILGASTWGFGDLQDDWDAFLPQLVSADLSHKTVALFGLGDAVSYADTFVDGMGELYENIKDKGCTTIGEVKIEDYCFDESKAVFGDKFVGLPLDEDNNSDLIEVQIEAWTNELKNHF